MISLYGNNCTTTLANAITNVATTLTVFPGAGASFPSPSAGQYFVLTLSSAGGGAAPNEIMWVTAVSGDTFTIKRAQEGTTAVSWNAGDLVNCYPTAGTMSNLIQQDQEQKNTYGYAVASGTINAITATIASNLTTIPDGMCVVIQSSGGNSTAATFNLTLGSTVTGAASIVKGNGDLLLPGDIPAAGYPIVLYWNNTNSVWAMSNPTVPPYAGIVGACRGLTFTIASASSSMTLGVTQLLLNSSGIQHAIVVSNLVGQPLNISTVGAGGLDTGSPPTNGYVGIYVIYNPTTATVALLGVNANSFLTEVYSGSHMPSGYVYSALVSVIPTNGSGQFTPCYQIDRYLWITSSTAINWTVTQASFTSLSLTSNIPANAKIISGDVIIGGSGAGTNAAALAGLASGVGSIEMSTTGITNSKQSFANLGVISPQLIYYTVTVSSGSLSGGIFIKGYSI